MENIGTGAGLGAMGFWIFLAVVIAMGVLDNIRKRDAQHETLRRAIESGQPIDDEFADKLLSLGTSTKDTARDLRVSGWIMVFVAPGLVAFGWLMSLSVAEVLLPVMTAVGALVAFIAMGLLVAARIAERRSDEAYEQRR
jgi:hypothetical protein